MEVYIMLQLSDREWAEFKVGELFDFYRGKRITKKFAEENPGNTPVISGGDLNAGILCYIDENSKRDGVTFNECITVASYGTAGCVHYHGYKCFISDSALALKMKNKAYDNPRTNLFLVTLLRELQYKYSYGHGVTVDRYSENHINLPINTDGTPDYQFMHDYIAERESQIIAGLHNVLNQMQK